MSIAHYIKEIGRGKAGARPLSRQSAADLFGLVLDGAVSELEIGAFCMAMRIKGETSDELLGFIDASESRIQPNALPSLLVGQKMVVIPSYNGARKLPLLTPLLAALLARAGCQVLVHGLDEGLGQRVTSAAVFAQLALLGELDTQKITYASVSSFAPALQRLLDVRRVVGLRNSAHSVVKLINPYRHHSHAASLLVTSYTHPEYAVSMRQTLMASHSAALLLRGTEGEAVADPRRAPAMVGLRHGLVCFEQTSQTGTLSAVPQLPQGTDAAVTARYIQAVLNGAQAAPPSIAAQVDRVLQLL
jgi:anthranilate phosphoribosyltransferase